jgi:hypothetical protein
MNELEGEPPTVAPSSINDNLVGVLPVLASLGDIHPPLGIILFLGALYIASRSIIIFWKVYLEIREITRQTMGWIPSNARNRNTYPRPFVEPVFQIVILFTYTILHWEVGSMAALTLIEVVDVLLPYDYPTLPVFVQLIVAVFVIGMGFLFTQGMVALASITIRHQLMRAYSPDMEKYHRIKAVARKIVLFGFIYWRCAVIAVEYGEDGSTESTLVNRIFPNIYALLASVTIFGWLLLLLNCLETEFSEYLDTLSDLIWHRALERQNQIFIAVGKAAVHRRHFETLRDDFEVYRQSPFYKWPLRGAVMGYVLRGALRVVPEGHYLVLGACSLFASLFILVVIE